MITRADEVAGQTVDLLQLTSGLENGRSSRLIVLDACRNNPLRGRPAEEGASPVQDGLARVGSAAGFLFAYATQPGNVAFDGGGRNSPFAQAFLSHLPAEGRTSTR